MLRPFVALMSGLIFCLGLIVSDMVSPGKTLAFLDITGRAWDPSVALVLISAVSVSAIGVAIAGRRKSPLLAASFSGPLRPALDRGFLDVAARRCSEWVGGWSGAARGRRLPPRQGA